MKDNTRLKRIRFWHTYLFLTQSFNYDLSKNLEAINKNLGFFVVRIHTKIYMGGSLFMSWAEETSNYKTLIKKTSVLFGGFSLSHYKHGKHLANKFDSTFYLA